jgi:beta-phosphoglucomutase
MKSLEAILVDFDGTLVSTESANAKAYALALQDFGFNASKEVILQYSNGHHWSTFLPNILKDQYSQDIGIEIAKNKKVIYPKFFDEITINEPLLALLKHFKELPKALVTNASRDSVMPILDKFRINSLFKTIICQEDVANPKPSPEGYLLAISLLAVNKQNCLAIEDSETGMLAAKNADIPLIRVFPFIN